MASPEKAPTPTQTAPGTPAGRRRGPPAGRGRIRPILAGLGAFLMVFGLLLRVYVAPRLIAAPASFYIVVTLADPHASYFDQGALTTRRDVTLTYNDTIRGDAGASTGTIAVWDQFTVLEDRKRKIQLIATFQRNAFNRHTGELTSCCGASVNDDTQVRQDGIGVVFWPIGTRQATYRVYDTTTERAWPAAYTGTAHVQGLLTYRFAQRIPVTVVQQVPGVPTSLLGLRGPSRNAAAITAIRQAGPLGGLLLGLLLLLAGTVPLGQLPRVPLRQAGRRRRGDHCSTACSACSASSCRASRRSRRRSTSFSPPG